jgi:hypothetical protein
VIGRCSDPQSVALHSARICRPTLLGSALAIGITLLLAAPAAAQDVHLLVIAGVGGDEAHSTQFHKWATTVIDSAKKHGLPDTSISYLAERTELDPERIKLRSTRENVLKAFADLAARVKGNDDVIVLLIGHGTFDGKTAAFNLPGPDLAAAEYAKLLEKFPTQRIAFIHTGSSSGAFVPVLAGPARTIVAATRTGGERNETRFPEYFVEALAGEEADRDRNGRVSILEAFDFAKNRVAASYEKGGHLLTEHATLDDGSEGKLASAQYLAPPRSRSAEIAKADPKLRALVEERDALDRDINALRLRKDQMKEEEYQKQLEKLLTDLALKDRAIRELEAKK